MNHPKPEVWMTLPDLWLTPAAHPAEERAAAAAFQSRRKTSSEVLCLERGSVWGLEPGVLDKPTGTRESHFQSNEWPTSHLQGDNIFSRWFVLYLSYSSKQLHFESTLLHVCDGKYWAAGTATRKGRTCLCIFPFPVEFRIVSSGIFLSFDIFKEGSHPICCRQRIW